MGTLAGLLESFPHEMRQGRSDQPIDGVTSDSRRIRPGWAFVAISGIQMDGHQFIPHAIDQGAVAVVAEKTAGLILPPHVSCVRVSNTRCALAHMSAAFREHPSGTLALVGVTGTKGKTTTTYLLEAMLRASNQTPGVIGTISYRYADRAYPADQTTPGAEDLQRLLREMVDANVSHCVMEVSSHALALDRVRGCRFAAALFTNLRQDHFDFHGDVESYYRAKARLFCEYPLGIAIVNRDDPYGQRLLAETRAPGITYGFSAEADVAVMKLVMDASGMQLQAKVGGQPVGIRSPLIGRHNVYNVLGALAAGVGLGLDVSCAIHGIMGLAGIPGRFERVDQGQPFTVLVDYAHTEDALRNVLAAARSITRGRVIVVFGAGGDRDRSKRPCMGRAAAECADVAVITSDNPRTEPPADIIRAIEIGYRDMGDSSRCCVIEDRASAIYEAMKLAQVGDVVIIAGKGHETYQIVGTQRLSFDDRLVAREALHALGFTEA